MHIECCELHWARDDVYMLRPKSADVLSKTSTAKGGVGINMKASILFFRSYLTVYSRRPRADGIEFHK